MLLKFKITSVERKDSQQGNDMLKLVLDVTTDDSSSHQSDAYITFKTYYQMTKLTNCVGSWDDESELVGRTGLAEFEYEEFKGKMYLKPKEWVQNNNLDAAINNTYIPF